MLACSPSPLQLTRAELGRRVRRGRARRDAAVVRGAVGAAGGAAARARGAARRA